MSDPKDSPTQGAAARLSRPKLALVEHLDGLTVRTTSSPTGGIAVACAGDEEIVVDETPTGAGVDFTMVLMAYSADGGAVMEEEVGQVSTDAPKRAAQLIRATVDRMARSAARAESEIRGSVR